MVAALSSETVRAVLVSAFALWPVGFARAQFQPYGEGFPVQDLVVGIQKIIQTSLLLVGVLALGMIVYGGFKYMAARGDEQEVQAAKSIITAGIVGVLIIGLAYAIVVFVFQALGA